MVRVLLRIVTLLTLSTLLLTLALAQGTELRYQAEKGVAHQYKITTDVKQKAQMMGQDFTSTMNNAIELSLEGQGAADNALSYVGKIDKNLSKIDSPMMKDTAMVSKEVNGKRVQMTVSPLGKVMKTVALDSIARPTNPMMGAMNPQDILRRMFLELPEKSVATGDTWKQTRPDTMNTQGMKIISKPDITYKVAGTETKGGMECLKITFEGTTTQYGSGNRQGMELVVDGKGKNKGTAYFAPKAGILVGVESTSSSDMNISGVGDQMFTTTQSVTTTSKLTLVK